MIAKISFRTLFTGAVLLFLLVALTGCKTDSPKVTQQVSPAHDMTSEQPDTDDRTPSDSDEGTSPDTGSNAQSATTGVKEFSITAKNWEFVPNTIMVNKGDTVRLKVTSTDVAHGLAIQEFNVNTRVEPLKTATVEFVADKAGSFSFVCSVFCGEGHRNMRGTLIVQ